MQRAASAGRPQVGQRQSTSGPQQALQATETCDQITSILQCCAVLQDAWWTWTPRAGLMQRQAPSFNS